MEDGEGLPRAWADIDRTALTRMLASGLTPKEVASLYGRSRDAARNLADRWGLDTRALRARSIGLAAKYPEVAAELIKVVSGAPHHYGPEDLLAGSSARCRWRCAECGEEWTASVTNRTTHGSGCPTCANRRAVDRARARPAASPPLARVTPEFAREFRRNLSRPDRTFQNTPACGVVASSTRWLSLSRLLPGSRYVSVPADLDPIGPRTSMWTSSSWKPTSCVIWTPADGTPTAQPSLEICASSRGSPALGMSGYARRVSDF
jgi:hypothetical protein